MFVSISGEESTCRSITGLALKAAVRSLYEAVNKRDFSIFTELFAPNYVGYGFGTEDVKGPEGVEQLFTTMSTALPDFQTTIEHMVAEGDMVAVFDTLRGTFKGEMAGTAPTGNKVEAPTAILARFENGRQVEAWAYMDRLAMSGRDYLLAG